MCNTRQPTLIRVCIYANTRVPRENEGTERDIQGVGWDMSISLKLFLVLGGNGVNRSLFLATEQERVFIILNTRIQYTHGCLQTRLGKMLAETVETNLIALTEN